MPINFLRISITSLWGILLALTPHCRPQTGAISIPPVEITPVLTATLSPPVQQNTDTIKVAPAPFPYEQTDAFSGDGLSKLSGVVFYPPNKTVFAVTDNGRIMEIEADGTVIQNKMVRKKADFEGITYNPITTMLYVAVEGKDVILEVNPETLEIQRDIPINRIFNSNFLISPKGNGIEGITSVPTGSAQKGAFYLVNQSKDLEGPDPSIVFEVEVNFTDSAPQATIVRYFSVGVTDLSGIYYDAPSRHLFIISDKNDLLLEVSLTGQVLSVHTLPGQKQEGITRDKDDLLYIAQDSKDALLKFRPLINTVGVKRE